MKDTETREARTEIRRYAAEWRRWHKDHRRYISVCPLCRGDNWPLLPINMPQPDDAPEDKA